MENLEKNTSEQYKKKMDECVRFYREIEAKNIDKYCPGCDILATCDFCCYYEFNGEMDGEFAQVYTGKGFCEFHKKKQDPEDECNDFKCTCLS